MKSTKIKKDFLFKLEFFYRNFGSDWSVADFSNDTNTQIVLKDYLVFLEEKGVVKLLDEDKFKIIDLPSNKDI